MWAHHSRSQSGVFLQRAQRVCFDPIFTPIGLALGASATTAAATGAGAVAAVGTIAGAGVTALSSIQQGQAQQKAANFNAQVSRNNAIGVEQASAVEADRQNLQARKMVATGVAAAGASGVDPNSGSPLEVMADLAGQAKLDEELGRWQARERAKGYGTQAALDTYSGRAARVAGNYGATTSLLQSMSRGLPYLSGGSSPARSGSGGAP